MRNIIFAVICILLAGSLQAVKRIERPPMTPEQLEKLKEVRLRQTGGFIQLKGHGHLAVFNTVPDAVKNSDIEDMVKQVKDFVRGLKIKVGAGNFSLASAKSARIQDGAGACVYIVDDAALPMSLIALEDGWGMVNIAPLKSSDEQLFARRVRKQIVRISSVVFAGIKSQYKISPLQSVTSVAELDKIVGDKYGVDTLMSITMHLQEIGVAGDEVITYAIACQRGIAEPPTNQYQKAIWDRIRSVPKKPMKIEFDPKKGR